MKNIKKSQKNAYKKRDLEVFFRNNYVERKIRFIATKNNIEKFVEKNKG